MAAVVMKQLLLVISLGSFLFMWISYFGSDSAYYVQMPSPPADGSANNFRLLNAIRSDDYMVVLASQSDPSTTAEASTSEPTPRSNRTCVPKSNVFFLKTHKCASSTVQNILMRYGDKHGLNFVLPPTSNYLGNPEPFSADMAMPLQPGQHYNIFCHHTRYDHRALAAFMPNDTIFVTIIRDPVDLFESMFSYFDLDRFYGVKDIDEFARMAGKGSWFRARKEDKIGSNQMLFDLGVVAKKEAELKRLFRQLESQFHLVMLAEYFDESLVLLKKLLCWDEEDFVYFEQNARASRLRLGEETRRRLKDFNRGDELLYDYFANVFRRKVQEYGAEAVAVEAARLRGRNEAWEAYCVEKKVMSASLSPKFRGWSYKTIGFDLRKDRNESEMCENLAKVELPYTDELRQRHMFRHLPKQGQKSALQWWPSIVTQWFL